MYSNVSVRSSVVDTIHWIVSDTMKVLVETFNLKAHLQVASRLSYASNTNHKERKPPSTSVVQIHEWTH